MSHSLMKPTYFTSGRVEDLRSILFVVAMDVEFQAAQNSLEGWQQVVPPFGVQKFLSCKTDHCTFHLMQSGVGQVNAALSVDSAVLSCLPDAVILLGVGGSLHSFLEIGDLVIGNAILQHDSVYVGPNGTELMRPGSLHLSGNERPEPEFVPFAPLQSLILDALSLAHNVVKYRVGSILTGNQFVAAKEAKEKLAQLADNALLVEMESAGVARACERRNIPFAVAKTVSDRLSPQDGIDADYLLFLKSAAQNAAVVIRCVMNFLSEEKNG